MTIEMRKGDLLALKRGLLVHGCNAQGIMGAGIAAQVKDLWPENFKLYQRHCDEYNRVGTCCWYVLEVDESSALPKLAVVNAITQPGFGRGYRAVSYDAVEQCFEQVGKLAQDWSLPVYFPLIGAGLGGGKWPIIAAIIDNTLPTDVERACYVL